MRVLWNAREQAFSMGEWVVGGDWARYIAGKWEAKKWERPVSLKP